MIFKKFDVANNPNIGVYIAVSDEFAIVPSLVPKEKEQIISDTLGVKCLNHDVGESAINGVFCKIYKNKAILSKVATAQDVKFFEAHGFEVLILDSYFAVGNLIAIFEDEAVVSKIFDKKTQTKIKNFLNIKLHAFEIAEIPTIGSSVVVNKNGFAVHPSATEADVKKLKTIFGVKGNLATINYGDGFVGNGMLATNKGVLFGSRTTGYELIRIDDIFND